MGDKMKLVDIYNSILFEIDSHEHVKSDLLAQILAELGYYSGNKDESIYQRGLGVYNAVKDKFPGSKIRNDDGSLALCYHSSDTKFSKFKTPTFFGSVDGYGDSDSVKYYTVLNIVNPVDLRSHSYSKDKYLELLRDIFRDDPDVDNIVDFAKQYSDSYGFFKFISSGFLSKYKWDIVFDYIKNNGYDGAIYRESDESISYFFDGYIAMNSSQIYIVELK